MIFQEISESAANQGFTGWSAWTVTILILIIVFFYETGKQIKNKKFIKGYKNFEEDKTLSDKKKKRGGMRRIGEYLGEYYDKKARIWILRFRNGTKFFNAQSPEPMSEYLEVHYIDCNYIIYFSLNIALNKRILKESEWYKRELGYSLNAWLYMGLSFCMNLTVHGVILSSIIFGTFIGILFFEQIRSWAIIAGIFFGWLMCGINYIIHDKTTIGKNLLEPKEELVKEEYYITPLESPVKIINIYKVKGFERIETPTSDNSKKLDKAPLKGRRTLEGMTIEGNKRKLAVPNKQFEIRDLRDEEKDVDFILVEGFDNLFKLILNPHVEVEDFELVAQKKVHKTTEEIRDLTHDYLERNKEFADRIFNLRKENADLQKEYVDLHNQMNTIQETMNREIKKLGQSMLVTQKGFRRTLKAIFEEVYGDYIGKDWENVLDDVLKRIEMEKQSFLTDKLSSLVEVMKQLIEKLGESSGVNLSKFLEQLKLPVIEEGVETGE